jgi:hypothetical protein
VLPELDPHLNAETQWTATTERYDQYLNDRARLGATQSQENIPGFLPQESYLSGTNSFQGSALIKPNTTLAQSPLDPWSSGDNLSATRSEGSTSSWNPASDWRHDNQVHCSMQVLPQIASSVEGIPRQNQQSFFEENINLYPETWLVDGQPQVTDKNDYNAVDPISVRPGQPVVFDPDQHDNHQLLAPDSTFCEQNPHLFTPLHSCQPTTSETYWYEYGISTCPGLSAGLDAHRPDSYPESATSVSQYGMFQDSEDSETRREQSTQSNSASWSSTYPEPSSCESSYSIQSLSIPRRTPSSQPQGSIPRQCLDRKIQPKPTPQQDKIPSEQFAANPSRYPGKGAQIQPRRDFKNEFLIRSKRHGMSYGEIRERGGFTEAESTLRGRYRTLTKEKDQRVRKPEWQERDVRKLPGIDIPIANPS